MPNRKSFSYKVKKLINNEIDVNFVPDGWSFEEDKKIVNLYEHVTTHDLDKSKVKKLGKFWLDCDYFGWGVTFEIEHWYGAKSNIDLSDFYYEYSLKEVCNGG